VERFQIGGNVFPKSFFAILYTPVASFTGHTNVLYSPNSSFPAATVEPEVRNQPTKNVASLKKYIQSTNEIRDGNQMEIYI
jgi:hypothetical protein